MEDCYFSCYCYYTPTDGGAEARANERGLRVEASIDPYRTREKGAQGCQCPSRSDDIDDVNVMAVHHSSKRRSALLGAASTKTQSAWVQPRVQRNSGAEREKT